MSTLWTPSGEHEPAHDDHPDPAPSTPTTDPMGRELTPEEAAALEAEMLRARQELAATPVVDIIANHAVGLWQLAVLHLTPDNPDGPTAEDLAQASLAID